MSPVPTNAFSNAHLTMTSHGNALGKGSSGKRGIGVLGLAMLSHDEHTFLQAKSCLLLLIAAAGFLLPEKLTLVHQQKGLGRYIVSFLL